MRGEPKDPRSTYRRRLRRALEAVGRPRICENCGRTDDPRMADEAPGGYWETVRIEANHRNKVLADCDPANGQWLCTSCHKEEDSKTAKGVSRYGDEFGYNDGF